MGFVFIEWMRCFKVDFIFDDLLCIETSEKDVLDFKILM